MKNKKTVIIGASTNPSRYAYVAAKMLLAYGHEIVPVGIRQGVVFGQPILNLQHQPEVADVHTLTLYIGPHHQAEWYQYLINLKPKRVIFNPGTENTELEKLLSQQGVDVVHGCTLVMLSTGQY
jgi:hypothetical protein